MEKKSIMSVLAELDAGVAAMDVDQSPNQPNENPAVSGSSSPPQDDASTGDPSLTRHNSQSVRASNTYPGFKNVASEMVCRGVPVIPIPPCEKGTKLVNWPSLATTDVAQVEKWHSENPNYNCGAVAKPDGFWMLDCDLMDLPQRIEEETQKSIPATLKVRSRRGFHFYFRQTDASRKLGNRNVRGLFEAQVSNKYVVAPGSIHPDTKQPYKIIDDSPIIEAPVWLCEWLANVGKPESTVLEKENFEHRIVGEGGRNNYLTSEAGRLRRAGLSLDGLESELLRRNEEMCDPPLDEKEVLAIAKSVGRYEPARTPGKQFAKTDLGNAERFAADHKDSAKYCHDLNKWLIWQDTRWVPDSTGKVMQMAKHTARSILNEATELDDDQRPALAKHALKSEQEHSIKAMVSLARYEKEIPVRLKDLDCDPMLLNVRNGSLNLATGSLREHGREDFITKIAPVEYRSDATCPQWMQFLADITDGDIELQKYLQRAVGYTLTGETDEHALFLLYGTGCNGKTTFLEVLQHILGDYAQQADFDTFMTLRRSGGAARSDLAMLRGKRFVKATESEHGKQMAEAFVKAITGGDTVTARFLYGEYFEFKPQFKLWLGTNHKPMIRGTDEGIWRRIRLVPFTVRIPETKKDPTLGRKLIAEADGILRWAVEGLKDYRQHGLNEPSAVKDATDQYRKDQDALAHFIEARCVESSRAEAKARGLYEEYKKWAHDTEEFVMRERDFSQALNERGFTRVKLNHGIVWRGIGLATTIDWPGVATSPDSSEGSAVKKATFPHGDFIGESAFHPPLPTLTAARPENGQGRSGDELN